VDLSVTEPSPVIGLNATSLSFAGEQDGPDPADRTLDISNVGGGTLNWNITDDADWLSVSPASGTGASSVTVSVDISGLTAGSYSGTISVAATGASNTPQTVVVDLSVTEPPPVIGLSATSLSFAGEQDGPDPADQTLDISNVGGGTLAWNITDDADWLSVSPASGTDASTVTVSVDISGLTAGSYSGTISVAATGASNTPQAVSVDLSLTEPPPAPTYDGQWSGATSQSRAISFTIVDNALTTYRVGYSFWACGGSVDGTRTTTFGIPIDVSSGAFSSSSFSGRFTSETRAVGEVTIEYTQWYPYYCSYTSSATWSATR
jgi:hypothetical protein